MANSSGVNVFSPAELQTICTMFWHRVYNLEGDKYDLERGIKLKQMEVKDPLGHRHDLMRPYLVLHPPTHTQTHPHPHRHTTWHKSSLWNNNDKTPENPKDLPLRIHHPQPQTRAPPPTIDGFEELKGKGGIPLKNSLAMNCGSFPRFPLILFSGLQSGQWLLAEPGHA